MTDFTSLQHLLSRKDDFRFLLWQYLTRPLKLIFPAVKILCGTSALSTPSTKNMSNRNKRRESVSLWEMSKVETIEQFYKRKFDWVPENLKNEIGHFNVFRLDPYVGVNAKSVPYSRRDFFFFKKHVQLSPLKFRKIDA